MSPEIAERVRARADGRCEYCLLPDDVFDVPFQVDHVISRKHYGSDDESNLAYACLHCNSRKGADIGATDPVTGTLTRLFDPRTDDWHEHFDFVHHAVVGLTAKGRATTRLLFLNAPLRIALRRSLASEGTFPPAGPQDTPPETP